MATLEYSIAVVGVKNVEAALATIERRLMESSRRTMANAARVAGPRTAAVARTLGRGPEQEIRDAVRAASSLDRQRSSALFAQYKTRERLDAKASKSRERSIEREAALESRATARIQSDFRRRTGGALGVAGRSVSGIGKTALAVTGLGGGALVASRLGSAMDLEKSQRGLVVAGRGAGQVNPMSYEQVQQKVLNTSIATGASQSDVTAGMREYVSATGNLKEASDQIGSFTTIAQAAEASVSDVAKAGAYLSKTMGVTAKEMPDALAKLYFQGKKGAFELKDIASAVPMLGSQAATLGLHGMEGLTTLGGLSQIAQTGTGNAAEAQTALSNLFTQIVAKSDKLQSGEALGGHQVSVFEHNDPTKPMKNIREIIANMIAGSRGNVQQLEKFGEIRGSRALNPLVNAYKGAADSTKGTQAQKVEAGRQAVLDMIKDNADAAGTFKDVQIDLGDSMKSASAQFEVLNSKLTAVAQSSLLPALLRLGPPAEQLIPVLGQAAEALARIVGWASDNPFQRIPMLIAGKVALDLAEAGIGSAARGAIMSALAAVATEGGVAAAGAGLLTKGAGAAGLGATGTAVAAVALAGAAVGAAAYEAVGLYQDTKKSGGVWQGIQDASAPMSRPVSGDAYDARYGIPKSGEATQGKPLEAAGAALLKSAQAIEAASLKLAGGGINRGNSPSPVKS